MNAAKGGTWTGRTVSQMNRMQGILADKKQVRIKKEKESRRKGKVEEDEHESQQRRNKEA